MVKPMTVRELFFLLGEEIHKGNTDKIVYIGGAHRLNEGDARFLTGEELKPLCMFEKMTDEERENIVCLK